MWVPSRSVSLQIEVRRALIPVSCGMIVLVWLALTPPLWVMLLLASALPLVLLLGLLALRRQQPSFEREFSRLIQKEDADGLNALVASARAIRWFAPPGYIDAKRGLIAALHGDWPDAGILLERAYIRSREREREQLLPSILRAKYETGQWDEATEIARMVMDRSPMPGTAELFLGLISVRQPENRETGIALLEKAAESLGGEDRSRAVRALDEIRGKETNSSEQFSNTFVTPKK